MKRISIILISTFFLVAGIINSNFSKNLEECNTINFQQRI